jgi:acyl-CoA synthetase (AMP-forming)/AMP-acid ligase II
MTLADFIAPGPATLRIHFPAEATSVTYGEMWKSGEAVGWSRIADRAPVAIVLENTRACATVLVGAIAGGQSLVSVPMPPRGVNFDWYSHFIQRVCAITGAKALVMGASLSRTLQPVTNVRFLSFEDALALRGPKAPNPGCFTLTQFTSGSTADPKGIVLPGHKIVTNLQVLIDWLQPDKGDGACSWLPLSHDMGLIGMFLGTLGAAAKPQSGNYDFVLMTPQSFIRNPGGWLSACEEFKSTVTAAPNYSFEMVARRGGRTYDLKHLRTCIAGGEPIRSTALTEFAEALRDSGFNPSALRPSYGMAEAVLAVTGTRCNAHWHAADLASLVPDPDAVIGRTGAYHEIVSCGAPLPGYELRIDGDGLGEILLKGPSVADHYADDKPLVDAEGWFHTRDLGVLRDGELYVFGRTDDVFHVAGRNIYAIDIETCAGEVTGVRMGRVVAIPEGGALTLVAECEPTFAELGRASRLAQELKQQIVVRVGVAPSRVLLTRPGVLPLTASGKIRRMPLVAALQSQELKILPGSIH